MLKISHIDAYYDKVQALHNVSLEVGEHEIISLIGANGAGKSTLMKTIIGLLEPKNGKIGVYGRGYYQSKKYSHCCKRNCLCSGRP